jgi:hypothetical protein
LEDLLGEAEALENASHRESTQMDAESVTQRTVKSKKETLAKIEL